MFEKRNQYAKGNPPNKTSFKKGHISWNKNKKCPQLAGKNNPFFGKHHSEEAKRKISIAQIGKRFTKETKKRISEGLKKSYNLHIRLSWNKGKYLSEGHKRKISKALKGPNSPSWKGGIIKSKGRFFIHKPKHPFCDANGYIRQSRFTMEQMIGRYLRPEEVVHHINGIKDDDRPENLKLFANQKEHLSII